MKGFLGSFPESFAFTHWPLHCSYDIADQPVNGAAKGKSAKAVLVENVLILDDYPAILHGIADVLRSEHYSTIEASTGWQAIESARKCGRLSLLVSDIELPDLSGTEVALALRNLYPHLPTLFISANAIADWTIQDRANLKRFRADSVDFLEKPFSASDLTMRVRNLIGPRTQVRIDQIDVRNQAA